MRVGRSVARLSAGCSSRPRPASTPSDSSQSSASSSSSTIAALQQPDRRPGTPGGSPRSSDAARRRRWRAASSRPADRPSRGRRVTRRARAPGRRPRGRPCRRRRSIEVSQVSENEGLCSMYSSFTRSGPQTKSAMRVRRVDEVVDLDAEVLGVGAMLLDGVDEDADVVQQRTLGIARVAWRRSSRYAPPTSSRPSPTGREAERLPLLGRRHGIRGDERDVVEVELGVGLGLDEHDLDALAEVDGRIAAVERRDPEADPRKRAAFPRPLCIEERELAAARIGAEQREAVGLLDHAHAEPLDRRLGHPAAVCDPERNVIERARIHACEDSRPPSIASSRRRHAAAAPCSSSSGPRCSGPWPPRTAGHGSAPSRGACPSGGPRGGSRRCLCGKAATTHAPHPDRARSLLTVRAAISSALSSDVPRSAQAFLDVLVLTLALRAPGFLWHDPSFVSERRRFLPVQACLIRRRRAEGSGRCARSRTRRRAGRSPRRPCRRRS